jgi:hypothetical protein
VFRGNLSGAFETRKAGDRCTFFVRIVSTDKLVKPAVDALPRE